MEAVSEEGAPVAVAEAPRNVGDLSESVTRTCRKRSSTTSSVFVDSTMSHPDHARIIEAVAQRIVLEFERSEETYRSVAPNPTVGILRSSGANSLPLTPDEARAAYRRAMIKKLSFDEGKGTSKAYFSVSNMVKYMTYVFKTAELSTECTIMAYIYIKRMVANGGPRLYQENWRPIMISALLLASKVWDDLSMINVDFGVLSEFGTEKISHWEASFLNVLDYHVTVTASEYTKEYFNIRDYIKSQLQRQGVQPEVLMPLSNERAAQLEALSVRVTTRLQELSPSNPSGSPAQSVGRPGTPRSAGQSPSEIGSAKSDSTKLADTLPPPPPSSTSSAGEADRRPRSSKAPPVRVRSYSQEQVTLSHGRAVLD